jgi:hypothetical protein
MNTPVFNQHTLNAIENLENRIKEAKTPEDIFEILKRLALVLPNNYDLGYYMRIAPNLWSKTMTYDGGPNCWGVKDIGNLNSDSKEYCIICGKETPYTYDVNINFRYGYVEGAGQLCTECYDTPKKNK